MSQASITFPAPGTTSCQTLHLDTVLQESIDLPCFAISGATDGPRVCIMAGIHGAEYPPIDAVMRFCRHLDPKTLSGRIIAIPVVNRPAFEHRTPFVCPRDGKNLNRMFPGKPDGTYSEVLAYHLFDRVVRTCDYLFDLHGGDMVEDLEPFSLTHQCGREPVDTRARELALMYGLPYTVVERPSEGPVAGTSDIAAAELGIPAVIAEAGGIGLLTPDAVALHTRGLERCLQHLNMLQGTPAAIEPSVLLSGMVWIRSRTAGFFRKAIKAGDKVETGSPVGQMVDSWGEPQEEITSPVAGVVLFATTSPAMAADGLVAGLGIFA